jgi:hypothetical protein
MKTNEPRRDEQSAQGSDMQNAGRPADREEVSRRAYQRYEERGRSAGHDVDDWLDAERDLRRESGDR